MQLYGSFILRQRVRGVRALYSPFISCKLESTSYAAVLMWDQKRGLGKQNYLDSLAHTYIRKSLIHNTFTQEESVLSHN